MSLLGYCCRRRLDEFGQSVSVVSEWRKSERAVNGGGDPSW